MSNLSRPFLFSAMMLIAAVGTAFVVINTPLAIMISFSTAAIVGAVWSLRE